MASSWCGKHDSAKAATTRTGNGNFKPLRTASAVAASVVMMNQVTVQPTCVGNALAYKSSFPSTEARHTEHGACQVTCDLVKLRHACQRRRREHNEEQGATQPEAQRRPLIQRGRSFTARKADCGTKSH